MVFEDKFPKVTDFEAKGNPRVINPGFSEIDLNNHVNNTKYANYVMDAVAPSKGNVPEVFQIEYRKEVLEGTQLHIYCEKNGKEILAKGTDINGDIMFACKLEYK